MWYIVSNMEPSEVEFVAESATVDIVPNFTESKIFLLEGDIGPFTGGLMTRNVPLWIAADLRKRQKCRIVQPEWLNTEILENDVINHPDFMAIFPEIGDVKIEEKESPYFTKLPHKHMFVVAQTLFNVALVDLVDADRIKVLIRDIWDVRQAKLGKSIKTLVERGLQHAKLDHLELIELNTVRPLLPQTMDAIHRMEMADVPMRNLLSSASSAVNTSSFY